MKRRYGWLPVVERTINVYLTHSMKETFFLDHYCCASLQTPCSTSVCGYMDWVVWYPNRRFLTISASEIKAFFSPGTIFIFLWRNTVSELDALTAVTYPSLHWTSRRLSYVQTTNQIEFDVFRQRRHRWIRPVLKLLTNRTGRVECTRTHDFRLRLDSRFRREAPNGLTKIVQLGNCGFLDNRPFLIGFCGFFLVPKSWVLKVQNREKKNPPQKNIHGNVAFYVSSCVV